MEWFLRNPVTSILNMVFTFITPLIMMYVVELLLPVRKKRWTKPLLYVGCLFFAGMIIYIGDPVNLPGALLALTLTVLICCEGSYLQRFSIFLILSSLGMSFNTIVDSFFGPDLWQTRNVLRFFMWLLVYFVLKRFAPKQEYHLPPRLWALLDVLTLTPFAATLITVLLGDEIWNASDIRDVLLLPVVTLSSFGLLLAVVVLAQQQKLEQEKSFYHLNRMYYQNLEQEQLRVRRLRHDMANHLQTMSALPETELHIYLNELIDSPAMEPTLRFCENNVVNIVIAAKKEVSEQSNIIMEVEMSVPQELPVCNLDLCALFANSLDNAIEACAKLPEDNRRISVKARVDKGLFVLQVQNSVNNPLKWKNGIPATTKQDDKLHGLGLVGIREIAKRYGGSMDITADEGQFVLLVYIPLSDRTIELERYNR